MSGFLGQSVEIEDATGTHWVGTNFFTVWSLVGPECNAAARPGAFCRKGTTLFPQLAWYFRYAPSSWAHSYAWNLEKNRESSVFVALVSASTVF